MTSHFHHFVTEPHLFSMSSSSLYPFFRTPSSLLAHSVDRFSCSWAIWHVMSTETLLTPSIGIMLSFLDGKTVDGAMITLRQELGTQRAPLEVRPYDQGRILALESLFFFDFRFYSKKIPIWMKRLWPEMVYSAQRMASKTRNEVRAITAHLFELKF